ncbi:hypothetical protein ZWY2020_033740, partial [Hordeum vulgare]
QALKAQNDLLNELNDNYVRVVSRGGRMTQEPLYPEGHPKRIEQDSQGVRTDAPSHPRKKKKDDRNLHASNAVAAIPESPNDVFVCDAETQSGDEHEPNDSDVHVDAEPSIDKDVEIEPVDLDNPQPKNKRYDKNDFGARKHGNEREPWVQKPMPFPPKPSKKKDDEDFERFVEMIRPVFLQMRLTDMLKMSPYAKYMKDILTNKRRIPEVEISTMLANYTFEGGTPKKLDFVIVDIPEDDAMAVILGRPFLNTAGAVIDCNKGNVTFHVNGDRSGGRGMGVAVEEKRGANWEAETAAEEALVPTGVGEEEALETAGEGAEEEDIVPWDVAAL